MEQQTITDTKNRPVKTKAYESFTDIKGVLTQIKRNAKKDSVLIVIMHHRNGTRSTRVFFLEDTGVFIYKKFAYIVDDTAKKFDVTYHEYVIEYFEGISLPIKLILDYEKLEQQAIETEAHFNNDDEFVGSVGLDVVSALNPHSLYTWIKSSVIQKVLKGELIDEMLKKVMFFLIITFAGVAIILVLNLYTSGLLSQIPGLG